MATDKIVRLSADIPQVLSEEVERVARTENTTPDALVQEALERMFRLRRLQKHYVYGEERARTAGLAESDVPRLIDEIRRGGSVRGS